MRRIAANIAKLPELLRVARGDPVVCGAARRMRRGLEHVAGRDGGGRPLSAGNLNERVRFEIDFVPKTSFQLSVIYHKCVQFHNVRTEARSEIPCPLLYIFLIS